MSAGSFEFNRRELAGSLGDMGTLVPFAVGYIFVCGINPAGLLIMLGLTNIIIGFVYKIPLPLQPMKVIAVIAIAQQWSPSMVYTAGFAMGIIWLLIGLTGLMGWLARVTPHAVTRGIQLAMGILLAVKAFKMIVPDWFVGIIACILVVSSINNIAHIRQLKFHPFYNAI